MSHTRARRAAALAAGLVLAAVGTGAHAQVKTVAVADGIWMLMGSGGNIGVSAGPDGVYLIDDQFAPATPKILEAVAAISDQPVRMVFNTHWHGDHTGGNENLGRAGALIVAHDNVRARMSTPQRSAFFKTETEPSPAIALPVVTFDSRLSVHVNGDTIEVLHVPPAHTDGDSILFFKNANVVHMGDTFFNGFFPYIDVESGGSIRGMIAAIDLVLPRIDGATRVIPGHGPLTDRARLVAFRNMLEAVADRVGPLVREGRDIDAIVAARPTQEFDAEWGKGFIKPDEWVRLVARGFGAR